MKKLILITFYFFNLIIFSQSLNNDYPIDSIDIKNSFELLGIEMFKFPLKVKEKEYYINYIVEEVVDNEKEEKINYFALIKSQNLPKEILKNLMVKIDKKEQWFRVYFFDKEKGKTKLKIQLNDNQNFIIDLNTCINEKFAYRAFDFSQPKIGKRTPIVVRYAKKNVNKIEHCPGNITVNEISKLYEHLIVIYIELIEL